MRFSRYEAQRGEDINELAALVSGREREFAVLPISELAVGPDGSLLMDQRALGMTRLAAHRLGQYVKIPGGFIDKAPNELMAYNFNQLLPTTPGTVQLAIQGETVVGVLHEKARPIPPEILIEQLETVQPHMDLEHWDLTDAGIMLRYTSPDMLVEPRVGDIVKSGVDVWDYENASGQIGVMGALYRLWCSNGATVREVNFSQQIKRELWREPAAVVMAAAGYFQDAIASAHDFGTQLRDLTEIELDMPVDADEREKTIRPLLKPVGIPGRFLGSVVDAMNAEEPSLFGFYNAVTRLGRDAADTELRRKFERAGYQTIVRAGALRDIIADAAEAQ